MRKIISVVFPVFNEEESIEPIFSSVVRQIPKNYNYEIILVDDGSSDGSRVEIQKLGKDKRVRGIFFYKNFGHQAALLAGISVARGDAVITMDADFQHPPGLIPLFIKAWLKGSDLVVGKKQEDTSGGPVMTPIRKIGYLAYKLLSGETLIPGVSDFRLMDKRIVSFIKECPEYRFVLRGMAMFPARRMTIVPYVVGKRLAGRSKYSLRKLSQLFLYSVTSFSLIPLRLAGAVGITLTSLGFLYLVFVLVNKFFFGGSVIQGWTALIFLLTVSFGFTFLYLGIIGEYLGAVFEEVKKRPRYMIEKTINLDRGH